MRRYGRGITVWEQMERLRRRQSVQGDGMAYRDINVVIPRSSTRRIRTRVQATYCCEANHP
jgi:hypothetical protein